jgi:hypothetical protein
VPWSRSISPKTAALETCSNRLLLKPGRKRLGLVEEHHGFAEALALLHHLDNLFDALGRGEGQLDLAENDNMEAGATSPR